MKITLLNQLTYLGDGLIVQQDLLEEVNYQGLKQIPIVPTNHHIHAKEDGHFNLRL